MVEGHAWVSPTGHPGDGHPPPVRFVVVGLPRVGVPAILVSQHAGLRCKGGSVKGAHLVSAVGWSKHPEISGRIAVQRHLVHVRTLRAAGKSQRAQQRPVREIRRAEDPEIVVGDVERHPPLIRGRVPEETRIAVSGPIISNDRHRILGEGLAVVGGIGNPLLIR